MIVRVTRSMGLWLAVVCLVTGGLTAAERDLYVALPKTLPAGTWKKYLGEIGSDTLVTYKFGKDPAKQSSVSIVWFDNLYNTRELLEKTAPTLKKVLETEIHKGDSLEPEKQPAEIFGLKAGDKSGLVVCYEFKHAKTTEGREAGSYRYYYLFKRIDAKTTISLGIEVRLLDPEHAGPIGELLAHCGFRTAAEIQAEAEAATPKPAPVAPKPADNPDAQPADGAKPAEAPKTETPAQP